MSGETEEERARGEGLGEDGTDREWGGSGVSPAEDDDTDEEVGVCGM